MGPWEFGEGHSDEVQKRLGWGGGLIPMGSVGRGIQTVAMAKVSTSGAVLQVIFLIHFRLHMILFRHYNRIKGHLL